MREPPRFGLAALASSGMRQWVKALGLATVLVACGGPAYGEAWIRSFNAGRRAMTAGRYEEAVLLYAQAARDASRAKDHDEALFMQARVLRKLGRNAEARALYDAMLIGSPDGARAARVRFEQARLAIEASDPKGYDLLEGAIARHPEDGGASAAIVDWSDHLRVTGSEEALRARIDTLLAKLSAGEAIQQLEYERAASLERSKALREAHEQFLLAARRHPLPHGALTDDAYFRASLVAEALGDGVLAIADLRELLDAREVAWFGQSYERPKYPLAQMRIAELYRDVLRDDRSAREEFRRVTSNHPTSILGDDATWQEALAAKRMGDLDGACQTATRLRDGYPSTRYRRCLTDLCPSLSAASPSAECPPYLRAQLEPGAPQPRTTSLARTGSDAEPPEGG